MLDPHHLDDVGVPASPPLLALANAVMAWHQASDEREAATALRDLAGARSGLESELGTEASWEAAATVGIFNGLVRVADGTGIQLDGGVFAASADIRARSGIDRFAGAANSTAVSGRSTDLGDVHDLFA